MPDLSEMADTFEKVKAERDKYKGLILRLYQARQAVSAARKAHRLKAQEVGGCDGPNHGEEPCYYGISNREYWCDICQVKQPLWEDWKRKSALSGSALRAVLSVSKALAGKEVPGLYPIGAIVADEDGNQGTVIIRWDDGDLCWLENDAAHPNPVIVGHAEWPRKEGG